MKKIQSDSALLGILIGIAMTLFGQFLLEQKKVDVLIQNNSPETEIRLDGKIIGYHSICVSALKKGPHSLIMKKGSESEKMTLIVSKKGLSARTYNTMTIGEKRDGITASGITTTTIELTDCTK